MKIKAPKNPYTVADIDIRGLYGTRLKSWLGNPVSDAARPRTWRMYIDIRGIGENYSYGIYKYRTEGTLAFAKRVREIVESPRWDDYRVLCLKEGGNRATSEDVDYTVDIWQQQPKYIEQWVELKRLRPQLENEDIGMLKLETITNRYRMNVEPVTTKKTVAYFDRFQWKLVKDFFEGFASLADACESRR